jgi:hypothetical protein
MWFWGDLGCGGARTLGFLIIRGLLAMVGLGPAPDAKDVEIAVLRHQLAVVGRRVAARPRYTVADRMVLASLAKLIPRQRWTVFLVTPAWITPGRPETQVVEPPTSVRAVL